MWPPYPGYCIYVPYSKKLAVRGFGETALPGLLAKNFGESQQISPFVIMNMQVNGKKTLVNFTQFANFAKVFYHQSFLLYVCMHVCVCMICDCVCLFICVYCHVCMCLFVCVYVYVCAYHHVCMYLCVSLFMRVYCRVYVYVCVAS